MAPTTGELLFRLILGMLFGGVIGLERQLHGRPAGFRTHILVCTAAVLLMEVSAYSYLAGGGAADGAFRVDPGRIAAGAITGVGFLGAGVILKLGANVHGLTTAASLWIVSAIGLAIGVGFYRESTLSFGITIFALVLLRKVEPLLPHSVSKTLIVKADCGLDEGALKKAVLAHDALIMRTDYEHDSEGRLCMLRMHVVFKGRGHVSLKPVVDDVSAVGGVKHVSLVS